MLGVVLLRASPIMEKITIPIPAHTHTDRLPLVEACIVYTTRALHGEKLLDLDYRLINSAIKLSGTFRISIHTSNIMSDSARQVDSYDHYADYDDFGLGACGKGGGGGGHMTKCRMEQSGDRGPGKVYSSKHVRLLEARRDDSRKNSSNKTCATADEGKKAPPQAGNK